MPIRNITVLLIVLVLPMVTGCGMKQLRMENEQLKMDVDNLKQVERDYSDRLQSLEELSEQEKAQLRQEMIAMRQELNDSLAQKAAEKNVLVAKLKDLTIIEIGEAAMFGSGLADLTKQGAGIVEGLADVLNQYPNYQIRVEGHTDAVPIGQDLKSTFASNWELSTARATSVVRYMIYGLKVVPERLSAVGYAHYRPIADNDTYEGKAKNRRIRLVVFKRVEEQ